MKQVTFLISLLISLVCLFSPAITFASYHFSDYRGLPPIHIYKTSGTKPAGLTPDQIKAIYNLPETGGSGTIAIIDAYDDPNLPADLADFSNEFHLPTCTVKNKCLTIHKMSSKITVDSGWNLEETLDVEWAHAIAPTAKILVIEATTPSGANLLKAIDYADKQKNLVSVSMSFGGGEFSDETNLDSHFKNINNAVFFASSGDNGSGPSWPAASPEVVAVGGTSVHFSASGNFEKETAWSGSGGGISAYEKAPPWQNSYQIAQAHGMRAIPDVSYDADPASGFSIVHDGTWRTVGGTSAGAPQWAAIAALGSGINNQNFYTDKSLSNNTKYFRDITSGGNGDCGYVCSARAHYDYVTGLSSPLTDKF